MAAEQIQLNEEMYCVVEDSPIDYFGSQEKRALRITTFHKEQKVSTWDIYLSEDTRYTLNIEVEEPYRHGRWMELAKTYWPGTLEKFSRPNAVWYLAGQWIIAEGESMRGSLHELKTKRILDTGKVFSYGLVNDIYEI